jgi:protein TonB
MRNLSRKQTCGSKFKPYMENGIAYPIKTEQPFEFNP